MFVSSDQIKNILASIRTMAWHRSGSKPLSETIMIRLITDV